MFLFHTSGFNLWFLDGITPEQCNKMTTLNYDFETSQFKVVLLGLMTASLTFRKVINLILKLFRRTFHSHHRSEASFETNMKSRIMLEAWNGSSSIDVQVIEHVVLNEEIGVNPMNLRAMSEAPLSWFIAELQSYPASVHTIVISWKSFQRQFQVYGKLRPHEAARIGIFGLELPYYFDKRLSKPLNLI